MNVILDASALLALLLNEPGSDIVLPHVRRAFISTVNISEAITRAIECGFRAEVVMEQIDRFEIAPVSHDVPQALVTADLRSATRHFGLSLGDRACLALAQHLKGRVYTADRVWGKLDIGLDIVVIR